MGTPETRARIVASARAVFAARGIGPATVQHVLDEASVSRRTFYQYFKSKEEVLSAVYDEVIGDMVRAVDDRVRRTADPVGKISAGVDAWLDHQLDGGALFVALQSEAVRPDSLLFPRREAAIDVLVAAIDGSVVEAGASPVDPLVFRGLVIGIEGLVLHLSQGDVDRSRLRRVANALMFAVMSNLAELPSPPRVRVEVG
ncbi:MAG: TetR/AcrR family transcriptional regulator [Alphaproteobacteria bacterium]|nr:TetR/AcrR family transcriptional regulator [Alphaproteobacteria bacterium]MCB9698407.1 TetR/AcrR family transcriptional regulator [Alphaproteobacteria bacterium]